MKFLKIDYLFSILVFIISSIFVFELFLFPGRPANFDSNYHITNIAQFSKILGQGEFPVIWMNNFANYGLPMGIFAHQLTNYLGGIITFLTQNPTTSYNILVFLAIFLSNIFLYFFLRFYFSPWASFLATFIFSFTPYRIFNIYVRGAMPEVFSSIFLPLILITLYLFIVKKKSYALFMLSIFITGLTLNHPMMLIVYSVLFIPYLLFLLLTNNLSRINQIKLFISTGASMLVGLLITSYYILPLNLEIKYFYYGLITNHITENSFLTIYNFFDPRWYYFTKNEIFPRGHAILFGLIESLSIAFGILYLLYRKFLHKAKDNMKILYFAIFSAALIIFFTIDQSNVLFQKIPFLNNIQFPWRFFSDLIFIPPIIVAFLYDKFPKKFIFVFLIIAVSAFSYPQLYGKNFNLYPTALYYFSTENAHSVLMNTIWTGKSEEYQSKIPQGKIIEGNGKIINERLNNSTRTYTINATTTVKMVDHTFYFPGWAVYVDGVKTNIEFQNPDYRGVITYQVPAGKHNVYLVFEDTKVRLLGKTLSIIFIFIFISLLLLQNKLNKLF